MATHEHILVDGESLCGDLDTDLPRLANGSVISRGFCGNCVSISQGAQYQGRTPRPRAATASAPSFAAPMTPTAALLGSVSKPSGPRTSAQQGSSLPKVSVLTCSYNRPDLLREAVQSLLDQTDPDWEQLICDDSSTDPRVDVTLRWAEQDPRIRVWRRGVNIDSPAVLWNFMLDRARGRYIAILDDDNSKLPCFVERMSAELDAAPHLGLVTCVFDVIEGDTQCPYPINLSTSPAKLELGSTCDGGSMLVRREVFARVGYYAEALRTVEDWDWLRRAVNFVQYKNLDEVLATYRVHLAQRMKRSHALGSDADIDKLRARPLQCPVGVRVVRPPTSRLTRSQEDAVGAADRAVWALPWVTQGTDVAVVLSPFQLSDEDIRTGVEGCRKVVTVHIEDPYALEANLARVRAVKALGVETWVSTNDAASVSRYRDVVGSRVIVCPLLGADESRLPVPLPSQRDIDVLLCGYAYPSRRGFVEALLPRLGGRCVTLVGDGPNAPAGSTGWGGLPVEQALPTLDIGSTYALHARARAVVCHHRGAGDCSDGPVQPASVNRGFMEGRFGARVFVDRRRAEHSLDPGDVVWYDGPADLAESLRAYLDGGDESAAAAYAAKCRILYSYQTRIGRIINCVRSPRFLATIP